jgi:hypothetical protein
MNRRLRVLLTSKTLWGAVFAAGSWLATQPKIGIAEIVQALGTVLSAAGVRDAITQATEP